MSYPALGFTIYQPDALVEAIVPFLVAGRLIPACATVTAHGMMRAELVDLEGKMPHGEAYKDYVNKNPTRSSSLGSPLTNAYKKDGDPFGATVHCDAHKVSDGWHVGADGSEHDAGTAAGKDSKLLRVIVGFSRQGEMLFEICLLYTSPSPRD